ncbi:MAG: mechanosensitive ion channel family protein [Acetobacteraceae bacterium]|nr:mechanosensitive ion channel family protein [Acetobacteraceae bacterium]
MRDRDVNPLLAPILLATTGFLAYALAPAIAEWFGLLPRGTGVLVIRDLAGICAWLALAWTCGRVVEILLRRAAAVSRRPAPYPRLLTDLIRAALFAGASAAILLFVFERSATGLVATSSVLIAVIGFALRYIISDVFSGIALGIDHPYRIGDWIETVEGSAGRVVEIGWRTTRLVSRDSIDVIVPNGLIAGRRLINYGSGEQPYRTSLRVALDPSLPAERAKRVLLGGALDAARIIPGLAPDVVLQEYADGAAVYVVRFMVPDYGQETSCRDAVGGAVLRALDHAGLGLARIASEVLLSPADRHRGSHREKLLGHIDLFRAFDETEFSELARQMNQHVFAKGAVIVRRGEPGQSLFVLVEGALQVGITDGADEPAIRLLAPGEIFGEMSLLTGQPRSATVTAATDVLVYEIHKEVLDPVLQRCPEVIDALAVMMADRLALNSDVQRIPDRQLSSPTTRESFRNRLRAFFQLT